ncbi:MAG: DNA repair protein RadC [Cellulosilyticum sp.]|nr:DNA repair protein RadC [Cellulosilyticum sp.]MEE1071229.1 DNA repair protein RadC [Cellulosilyticum sp.]
MNQQDKVEMPYEKFQRYGLEALTDSDLLAILLRTGTNTMNVQELAQYLLKQAGSDMEEDMTLVHLHELSYEQLQEIKGIGKVKALQIKAVLELSQRMAQEKYQAEIKISSPETVANYFMERFRYKSQECFVVIFVDTKCKMKGYRIVSEGSLTASIVHPREVYKSAIQKSAHSIIVLHNHPSGDPSPSTEDLQITKRLKTAGEVMGIPLLDHIIIGDNSYKSLREESYL